MVHDNEKDLLSDEQVAKIREEWNPMNWEKEEDQELKHIMQGIALEMYNMPDEEFREYVVRAYCA